MDAVQHEVRHIVSLLMKRPITEAIATEVKSIEGYRHLEIENAEWIGLDLERDEMTTGEQHGWIETLILNAFTNYALLKRAGRVYPGDVTFVLDGEPEDIRKTREPDVAFVFMNNVAPTQGFIYRAPDLAVEIISPSQKYPDMVEKVRNIFNSARNESGWSFPANSRLKFIHPISA
jgi:Uma2 family endonuclease